MRVFCFVAVLLTATFSAGCAGRVSNVMPSPTSGGVAQLQSVESAPLQYRGTSVVPNVFAQARGRVLRDGDVDAYIAKSVTGADRLLARELMALMPANQRGDFVYFDPSAAL